eukprot:TRINITY_DN41050_c0_g1_i1.p1 TRINITY_DN41050_c0_g1~~TRINITY_DN41050_c0_g1_i1.p1  ORF type:complete len:700 (-),score=128.72 TRINITY_DN41050_c0_g1_i1:19-2118(-)
MVACAWYLFCLVLIVAATAILEPPREQHSALVVAPRKHVRREARRSSPSRSARAHRSAVAVGEGGLQERIHATVSSSAHVPPPSSLLQASQEASQSPARPGLDAEGSGEPQTTAGGAAGEADATSSAQNESQGDTPNVELFPSPYGACSEKLGSSSLLLTGFDCRKLGGMLRNASLEDAAVGPCLLDMCSDGVYGLFSPGRCDDFMAEANISMGKGDCKELGGRVPDQHLGSDAEMIACTFALCYDTGGYALRPAGTCNQPVFPSDTQAQECRNLYGNVDPEMPGERWSADCQLDMCKSYVRARLEVDTRSVPAATTLNGAMVQFQVLGKWEEPRHFCSGATENETVTKDYTFNSWPEKVKILPAGADMWGIREIRMSYRGKVVHILSDLPVEGMSNDEAHVTSRYWVGLAGVERDDLAGSGPSPTFLEFDVPHLTRQWQAYGSDLGCHTRDDLGSMDNETKDFAVSSLRDCQDLCEERSNCYGLEVEQQFWRCTLFFSPIRRQYVSPGRECYTYWYDPKLTAPEVPKEESYYRMFKAMGGRCLDYDPEPDSGTPEQALFLHECSAGLTQLWHYEDGQFFSKTSPPKCLSLAGEGNSSSLVVLECGIPSADNSSQWESEVDGSAAQRHWRSFVSPVSMPWEWDGRRLRSQGRCVETNVIHWNVSMKPCDDGVLQQDWVLADDAAWQKLLLGGSAETSEA